MENKKKTNKKREIRKKNKKEEIRKKNKIKN
jgi:hypothetical protein